MPAYGQHKSNMRSVYFESPTSISIASELRQGFPLHIQRSESNKQIIPSFSPQDAHHYTYLVTEDYDFNKHKRRRPVGLPVSKHLYSVQKSLWLHLWSGEKELTFILVLGHAASVLPEQDSGSI